MIEFHVEWAIPEPAEDRKIGLGEGVEELQDRADVLAEGSPQTKQAWLVGKT